MDPQKRADLHSAGATVIHRSVFHDLPSHTNPSKLQPAFYEKWVHPFYLHIAKGYDLNWVEDIVSIRHEITRQVCLDLLGEFNWRPRVVGAYFAAVKGYTELTDIIGIHLLKSEVCYAGHVYALVLAYFNNEQAIGYLHRYLDYYLTKPELGFDQEEVLEALLYLDNTHTTSHLQQHMEQWELFCQQKVVLGKKMREEMVNMLQQAGQSELAVKIAASASEGEAAPLRQLSSAYFEQQIPILTKLSL